MYDTGYISLNRLSSRLGLSENYLRKLQREGKIPYLKIKNRTKFNEAEVREALLRLSSTKQRTTVLKGSE
jgi:excisionase family DNA binding protein